MQRSISVATRTAPPQRRAPRHLRPAAVESASEGLPFVVGCSVALAGLSAAYFATDPQKRRDAQLLETDGNEKDSVRDYFNGDGFDRWRRIYGTTDEVNKVQKDIRDGHAVTIAKVLEWMTREGNGLVRLGILAEVAAESIEGMSVCDAGCGTGSLAIPLSLQGAQVTASDISAAMVAEAKERFAEASNRESVAVAPVFETADLESLKGSYDTVTCLDVMIHYPQSKADEMISHLASLAKKRIIISFAPKTTYYSVLKRIGELFPGPSKATRAYLHAEADVEDALKRVGFEVVRREMTATSFYFSRLLEAVRI